MFLLRLKDHKKSRVLALRMDIVSKGVVKSYETRVVAAN